MPGRGTLKGLGGLFWLNTEAQKKRLEEEEKRKAKEKFERENPLLDNLPEKRLYPQTDRTKQSIFNDKIERAIKKLPDSQVGHRLYRSLQTMLLKGNDYTDDEKQVYEHFLTLLHTAQENPYTESVTEDHLDACHEYLKSKLMRIEGQSPRNGKPSNYIATAPGGKRFAFAEPLYKPIKETNFYEELAQRNKKKKPPALDISVKGGDSHMISTLKDPVRKAYFEEKYRLKKQKERLELDAKLDEEFSEAKTK